MSIGYLDQGSWWETSRDERMFCAVLWEHARKNSADFAHWLIDAAELTIETRPEDSWDLGYEVVFYRDFLWHKDRSASLEELPAKRTFDLCLFGENDIVIIEAKLCTKFTSKQNLEFAKDREMVSRLTGIPHSSDPGKSNIHLVGLACSEYWSNLEHHGSAETANLFEKRITWKQVSAKYADPVLSKSDGMYGKEREHNRNRSQKPGS